MNTLQKGQGARGKGQVRTASRIGVLAAVLFAVGCQQKMAEQPAPRPYDRNSNFAFGQSARPLEVGVVHRGQRPDSDAMVTGLSEKGRKAKGGDWSGAKAYDASSVVPPAGAPDSVENFAAEFPFAMNHDDLKRGQQRYNIYCALCHGAAGDAMGKIAERGYLRPPSYHLDPTGEAKDWSTPGQPTTDLPRGYSRGFARFGKKVPLAEVPVGYIFQVITWGYGGMPDHASQIAPEDRWRITAYIRALQLSQGAAIDTLPAEDRKKLEGNTKTDNHTGKH